MAMSKEDMISAMRAGEFCVNNARVLCTINILYTKYVPLKTIRYALPELDEQDISKSVNFLAEEEYIHVRTINEHAAASIADWQLADLEAKVSGKGIRLLAGKIKDDCVSV